MHRPRIFAFLMLLLFSSAARELKAQEPSDTTTEIHLITMGSAEHLYTRAGHLSLMVAKLAKGVLVTTKVYNYGDANWDNPWMVPQFLSGRLDFFLSSSGSLDDTVKLYGIKQARSVYRQKLQLSPRQAEEIAQRLEHDLKPENRNYRYHHVEAICTTQVRDLLDEVLGGVIRQQLASQASDKTVQEDIQWAFSGHHLASLSADLLFGRQHYRPVDLFYGLYQPARMRDALQRITVADPTDASRRVPLAGAPIPISERTGPPVITQASRASSWFALLVALILFAVGYDAFKQLPEKTRLAGVYLALWALPFGLIGLLITLLMVFSNVPEMHANELLASFPPSDLCLLIPALRWYRGQEVSLRLLQRYAIARTVLGAFCLIACATGLFIQKPVLLPALSMFFSLGLLALLRRATHRSEHRRSTSSD